MLTFGENQSQSQRPSSIRSAKQVTSIPTRDHLQHTSLSAELSPSPAPLLPHRFSSIPLHPPLSGTLQAKLAINKAGGEYEQEADRIADKVTQMQEPHLQRACACGDTCPTCRKKHSDDAEQIQTKRIQPGHTDQSPAPASVREVLTSPGYPLPLSVRSFMEPRFGYDFSSVSIHSDAAAAQSAAEVNAHAYTVGNNIAFGAGQFSPDTSEGRWLLAHELAHVVQQSSAAPTLDDVSSPPVNATTSPKVVRRHATTDCNPTQKGLIATAISFAKSNVDSVISLLTAFPLSPDVQNALWLFFRDSSTGTAATVAANLTKISATLDNPAYECETDCDPLLLGYIRAAGAYLGVASIHLCMNTLGGNLERTSYTIIHEVAHYTLLANDSAGYYDYVNQCGETSTTVGTNTAARLALADSYSCFVRTLLTGKSADLANAKGDLTGANILGIAQYNPDLIDLRDRPNTTVFTVELNRDNSPAMPAGLQYRWILRDSEGHSYQMTSYVGHKDLFIYRPAVESVTAVINTPTRNLLKKRGVTSGTVICHALSPLFEKIFELPVTFVPFTPAPPGEPLEDPHPTE